MRLIIRDQNQGIVAMVDDFEGTVPQEGQIIFHPDQGEKVDTTSDPSIHSHAVMTVKSVGHGILARSSDDEPYFIGRDDQVVVLTV